MDRPLVYCARCEYGERVSWDQIGEWAVDHDRHSVPVSDPRRGDDPDDSASEDRHDPRDKPLIKDPPTDEQRGQKYEHAEQ